MNIREARRDDLDGVRQVHLAAFPDAERESVAQLAADLLITPDANSVVAEVSGEILGHAAFSPVRMESDAGFSAYILAPVGVQPAAQNSGVGSQLIDHGIRQLTQQEASVLFVYGDPAYYGRFGFQQELASQFQPPYPLQYPFGWQAVRLSQHADPLPTGEIHCVDALNDPSMW